MPAGVVAVDLLGWVSGVVFSVPSQLVLEASSPSVFSVAVRGASKGGDGRERHSETGEPRQSKV
ncbi:hypothetical protein FA13DRAFT_1741016 [Coprinellus micaceus]|uniref:Uncharacterized protein n=1 Tax=Coprinellus micaceus TaxID=71717 RepID=A0A4Y7SKS9_COPMI|nr:hypothetical protein FA13DRAFT_1741016 [Coprinellus micaceus]